MSSRHPARILYERELKLEIVPAKSQRSSPPNRPGLRTSPAPRIRRRTLRSQMHCGQIDPVVGRFFADEREVPHLDAAAPLKVGPTRASHAVSVLSFILCPHLH